MEIQKLYEYLRDNGYILSSGDILVFSNKFYAEIKREKKTIISARQVDPIILPSPVVQDWKMYFIKFIQICVPTKCEGARGEMYDTNKFSEDAAKEFRKMIDKEGINYELLVESTKLYYKSGRFRKKISNYIVDGDWRSDYLAFKTAHQIGDVQGHIKKSTDNGEHNQWSY